MKSRLLRLLHGLPVLFASLGTTSVCQAGTTGIPQDLLDLHSIFADEIRANTLGNVYQSLGNRWQLEGKPYAALVEALNAYDLLHGTYSSSLEARTRNVWAKERQERARDAFSRVVEALNWPRIHVTLTDDQLRLASHGRRTILQHVAQPVLLSIDNQTDTRQRLGWQADPSVFDRRSFRVAARSLRYCVGRLETTESGSTHVNLVLRAAGRTLEKRLLFEVRETSILEGALIESSTLGSDSIARVRVTDPGGRYLPPQHERFGLVLRPRRNAERWSYADTVFRVRAPVGKVRVSVRRGLEYRPIDQELVLTAREVTRQRFLLDRWTHQQQRGWYSGDTHTHLLDPESALFEARAENLQVVEILAMLHLGVTYSREHFRGEVDPCSDRQHIVRVNEEYRNQPLGHVGLLNLKRLVEPISTGGLATPRSNFMRYGPRAPSIRSGWQLPRHGEPGFPDAPMLIEVMRQTHQQGGLVNWAHLRSSQWEFPIDAVLGEIDTVDILTHTRIAQALDLWYHLLNCGFRLPATAGTDREAPLEPVGHQRVYVKVDGVFNYANWIDGLRRGHSFVTNGPMVSLTVDGLGPGETIKIKRRKRIHIGANVRSLRAFDRLEIIVNGKVVRSTSPNGNALTPTAEIAFEYEVDQSVWIAARCMGPPQPDFFGSSHHLFAHTSPMYVDFQGQRIAEAASGCYFVDFLQRIAKWIKEEAYFENRHQREAAIDTVRQGMDFYSELCGRH